MSIISSFGHESSRRNSLWLMLKMCLKLALDIGWPTTVLCSTYAEESGLPLRVQSLIPAKASPYLDSTHNAMNGNIIEQDEVV